MPSVSPLLPPRALSPFGSFSSRDSAARQSPCLGRDLNYDQWTGCIVAPAPTMPRPQSALAAYHADRVLRDLRRSSSSASMSRGVLEGSQTRQRVAAPLCRRAASAAKRRSEVSASETTSTQRSQHALEWVAAKSAPMTLQDVQAYQSFVRKRIEALRRGAALHADLCRNGARLKPVAG